MGTRLSEIDVMPRSSEHIYSKREQYDNNSGFVTYCPDILIHLNESFDTVYVNVAYEKIFEVTAEKVRGLNWRSLPGIIDIQLPLRDDQLRDGLQHEGESFEFVFWTENGDEEKDCRFHARLYAEKNAEGDISYWIVARNLTALDVTEHEKMLENNYLRLVENLPDLVCRYSPDHKIVYANDACRYHFGMKPSQLINKTKKEINILSDESLKLWEGNLDKAFEEAKASDFVFFMEDQQTPRHFHTTIVPEMGRKGTVEFALAITREVTDQKRTEFELKKDNENLRSQNTYLDNFIYTIAHDLRGPVGNLKSLLWLYKLEKEEEAKKDIMQKLEDTFGRLDNRLNGLIGLIESLANLESKVDTCQLDNIIRDVQADLENRPDFTPYTINKHLDVKSINYIEAYMVSILSNLLSNIMKYRDPDRPLRIRVSTYQMGKFIILEVEDNGIGMDMKTMGNDLFKPFRRFTKQSEGKGIGLHIIKTMVEKNGGRIEVQSQPGEGTTFQLYLKEY